MAIAVVGLLFGGLALSTGLVLLRRRAPRAAMYVLISLPGLLGGAYHTWRLWP